MRMLALSGIALLVAACAAHYTQSPLKKLSAIRPGMDRSTVEQHLGPPVAIEAKVRMTALHYCRTGYVTDDFAVIVLTDDRVVAVERYAVTLRGAADSPDCSDHVRPVNFAAPAYRQEP